VRRWSATRSRSRCCCPMEGTTDLVLLRAASVAFASWLPMQYCQGRQALLATRARLGECWYRLVGMGQSHGFSARACRRWPSIRPVPAIKSAPLAGWTTLSCRRRSIVRPFAGRGHARGPSRRAAPLPEVPSALRGVPRHGRQCNHRDPGACPPSGDPPEALSTHLLLPRRAGHPHRAGPAAIVSQGHRGDFGVGDGLVGQVSVLPAHAPPAGRPAELRN